MGISFNYFTNIISVTSPQTTLTMQELADAIADEEATPWGMNYPLDDVPGIAEIAGKFSKGGVLYSEIIVQLYTPWQVQFWGGSGVTKTSGGSLLGGLGDVPVKATGTAGDITLVSQPTDGTLIVSGSGVTEQDKLDIANQVWVHADPTFLLKVIKNRKTLEKSGSEWQLIVYDDDTTTPILNKAMKDKDGNNITDLDAGTLAIELATSV